MGYSFDVYTVGSPVTNDFVVSFPYLHSSHVKVEVNGVSRAFTFLTSGTVEVGGAALVTGDKVRVFRDTPKSSPLVSFSGGAAVTKGNLDRTSLQSLYVVQEGFDSLASAMGHDPLLTYWDAKGMALINLGDSSDPTSAVSRQEYNTTLLPAMQTLNDNVVALEALTENLHGLTSDLYDGVVVLAGEVSGNASDAEADRAQTGLDRAAVAADATSAHNDRVQTGLDRAAVAADTATASAAATTSVTKAAQAASSAGIASSAKVAAEAARDLTLAAFDNFDDRYLGAKVTDPLLDNDGNALAPGELYFNTPSGAMRVYTGTAWVAAYVSGTGYLAAANDLSDVAHVNVARDNLGLANSAVIPAGTGASELVQRTPSGKYPAGDASLLTNLPSSGGSDLSVMNSFLAQITAERASGPVPGGYMHLFATDELPTKNGATYDAANKLYTNAAFLSATKFPLTAGMLSITGGIGSFVASQMIDDSTANGGSYIPIGAAAGAGWKVDLGSAQNIGRVRLNRSSVAAPYGLVLKYSDNDTDWTQCAGPLSLAAGWNDFDCIGAGAHRYWWLVTTLTADSANQWCSEIEFYTYSPTGNAVLVNAAITVEPAPNIMDFYILHKAIDAVTLNTDIKVRASRNNGANWSGYGTLTKLCDYDATYQLLKATVDLSGLPVGTSIKWVIYTFNAKSQQVRAVGSLVK